MDDLQKRLDATSPTPKLAPPTPKAPLPATPSRLIRLGSMLGLGLIVGGIFWVGVLRGENLGQAWFSADGFSVVSDIGLGIFFGALFSGVLWLAGNNIDGFIRIRERIAQTLDLTTMTLWHMVVLSLIAAIPEEIFFRGALQPVVGLIIASLIFGALHAITPLYFVYATVAGLCLGILANWHNNLWVPIAAHFAVDLVALWLMRRWVSQNNNASPSSYVDYATKGENSLLP